MQTPAHRSRSSTALLPRLRALPGVSAAGAINWLPLSGLRSATNFWFERPAHPNASRAAGAPTSSAVDPDYFRAMGIPLRDGRHRSPPTTGRASPRRSW